MVQPRTARAGLPFIWGILGFSLIGILALMAIRMSPPDVDGYEQKRAAARLARLTALRKEEQKTLNSYGWGDKAKGIVQIPISRAMELTLAELKAKGVSASSVKAVANVPLVVPPYVKSAAAPAPSAEPASAPAATPAPAPAAAPKAPEAPAPSAPTPTAAAAPAASAAPAATTGN